MDLVHRLSFEPRTRLYEVIVQVGKSRVVESRARAGIAFCARVIGVKAPPENVQARGTGQQSRAIFVESDGHEPKPFGSAPLGRERDQGNENPLYGEIRNQPQNE
jgi:hypothetical protein